MPKNDKNISSPESSRRSNREDLKKNKRAILLSLAGLLLLVTLLYGVVALIEKLDAKKQENDNKYDPPKSTIIFHTPDYNENIYEDEYYMGLDRSIYYCDIDTGMTVSIENAEYSSYDESVRFLYNFVLTIIAGDAKAYNASFDNAYFTVEGHEKKEAFTMQKLYNIVITKISITTKDGVTQYLYTLEYMIRYNNGTLRNDIGSDASRKQHITLSDKSGAPLIERVEYASMQR